MTLWTVTYQAALSVGFSRQEYWSGLPFPPPGDLPDPGIKPRSPAFQADSLPSESPGKPYTHPGLQHISPAICPKGIFILAQMETRMRVFITVEFVLTGSWTFKLVGVKTQNTVKDFPGGPLAKTPRSQCRGPGSSRGQGTRSFMPQLKILQPQLRIPPATTKIKDPTCYNQDPAQPNK